MAYSTKKKMIVIVMLIPLLCVAIIFCSYAEMVSTVCSDDISKELINKNKLRYCTEKEFEKMPLKDILVGNQWIALLFQNVEAGRMENVVGVYDTQGIFRYAVTFSTTGSCSLASDIEKEYLTIQIIRNMTYCTFDCSGTLINICSESPEGYQVVDNSLNDGNDNLYYLTAGNDLKDFFFSSKTIVKRKDKNGNIEIFFKSDYKNNVPIVPIFSILICICCLAIGWKVKTFYKNK